MSNAADSSRKVLGKGLGSLLPSRPIAPPVSQPAAMNKLAIEALAPNPKQPRSTFNQEALNELAASIKENGIIQPIIVRKVENAFYIIAGERRWRAAHLAGLKEVPIVLQDLSEERIREIALIENIQREDLTPIEVAVALDKLSDELGLTHDELASRTGKNRATITNTIRLLRLPAEVRDAISAGSISMGHAKVLLSLDNEETIRELANRIVNSGMTVRQLEEAIKRLIETRGRKKAEPPAIDPNVKAAIAEMKAHLGTEVRILEKKKGRGRIEIDYKTAEELDRIYSAIVGEAPGV
ncbi:MAG: ParB/RepB/Spo0J family partition protein [Acidobacteria bacterium]|nr:ParB/RepB/Spo0J family partition protein [Acidobacteriota bacterium]